MALIDLEKHKEPNWDLAIAAVRLLLSCTQYLMLKLPKVCKFIDGANHVARIAQLADCDIDFARKAISHLLYVWPI